MSVEAVGRNEPCPCGSGKKYKRCHGMNETPQATSQESGDAGDVQNASGGMGNPFGVDPNQYDPAMLMQFSQMMQRLPKGQLQQLQMLMGKAMNGKDVSKELATLQSKLPMEFQKMVADMPLPETPAGNELGGAETPTAQTPAKEESRFGKLWKKVTGK